MGWEKGFAFYLIFFFKTKKSLSLFCDFICLTGRMTMCFILYLHCLFFRDVFFQNPLKRWFPTPQFGFPKKWDGFPSDFHDHGGVILMISGYVLILSSKRGLDFRETACKKSFSAKMFALFGFQMNFSNFFLSGNRLFPPFPLIINFSEIFRILYATPCCRLCDTMVAHFYFGALQ